MKFWKKPNKEGYVDLTEKLHKQEQRAKNIADTISEAPTQEEDQNSSGGFFGFFANNNSNSTQTTTSTDGEERRKRLAKRFLDLTNRIEEQEKEMYKLKQRIEVLERKQRVGY
jgi:predicted RNase H-like nuclease (RuvC/YqgF family)